MSFVATTSSRGFDRTARERGRPTSVVLLAAIALATLLGQPSSAGATPDLFTGALDSPVAVSFAGGTATFTGGQVIFRTQLVTPEDGRALYATTSQLPGYANPLTLTFSQPVTGVRILVINLAQTQAHIGASGGSTVAINTQGTKLLTIAGPITTLTIEGHNYDDPGPDTADWDYAVHGVIETDQGEVALAATPPARPDGYAVTQILDTATPIPNGTGNFTPPTFAVGAAISGETVAVIGTGVNGQAGVYAGSGGPVAVIADTSTPVPDGTGNFTSFSGTFPASISGANVAFRAGSTGRSGIHLASGGSIGVVADTTTTPPGATSSFTSFGRPAISGSNVAFQGSTADLSGFYVASGDVMTTIADTNTPVPGGDGNFQTITTAGAISGSNVVFHGRRADTRQGIYTNVGGSLAKVADVDTPVPGGVGNFTSFGAAAISGSTIVFQATSDDSGGVATTGIYLWSAGTLSTVADASTPIPDGAGTFTKFGSTPAISGSTVVFQASGIWGQAGLYRYHRGVLSKVIGTNNPIDATHTVFSPAIGSFGADGTSIVFSALLGSVANPRAIVRLVRDPECGDGVADPAAGEECDDDNTADGDGCSASCAIEVACGDGTIGDGEECDDGNTSDGDGCSADCRLEDVCTQLCAQPGARHVAPSNVALVGTPGPDVLCGDERANTLRGNRGDDVLCGFGGNDTLYGGDGDDVLDGGNDDDMLRGDDGDDTLLGGPGKDTLYGNADADELLGEAGKDVLRGGGGNDVLDGGDDADKLFGDAGRDTCTGELVVTCEDP